MHPDNGSYQNKGKDKDCNQYVPQYKVLAYVLCCTFIWLHKGKQGQSIHRIAIGTEWDEHTKEKHSKQKNWRTDKQTYRKTEKQTHKERKINKQRA